MLTAGCSSTTWVGASTAPPWRPVSPTSSCSSSLLRTSTSPRDTTGPSPSSPCRRPSGTGGTSSSWRCPPPACSGEIRSASAAVVPFCSCFRWGLPLPFLLALRSSNSISCFCGPPFSFLVQLLYCLHHSVRGAQTKHNIRGCGLTPFRSSGPTMLFGLSLKIGARAQSKQLRKTVIISENPQFS